MTLPVLGTAEGYTEDDAKGPAIALGIALQITNILRDVGEVCTSVQSPLSRRKGSGGGVGEDGKKGAAPGLPALEFQWSQPVQDAVRGRIYLPKEDLDRFGVSESQILNGVIDENYKNLIKFEIQRVRCQGGARKG